MGFLWLMTLESTPVNKVQRLAPTSKIGSTEPLQDAALMCGSAIFTETVISGLDLSLGHLKMPVRAFASGHLQI